MINTLLAHHAQKQLLMLKIMLDLIKKLVLEPMNQQYLLILYINGAIRIPTGDVSQRPAAQDGLIRYNTENSEFEGYGNAKIGVLLVVLKTNRLNSK